jgi:hypothetical protein
MGPLPADHNAQSHGNDRALAHIARAISLLRLQRDPEQAPLQLGQLVAQLRRLLEFQVAGMRLAAIISPFLYWKPRP